MFSLSSVSKIFLISLLIYSVSCCLFINLLFNLHVFVSLTAFSRSCYKALRGLPCMGSFSVVWRVRHIEGSPGWGPSLLFGASGT